MDQWQDVINLEADRAYRVSLLPVDIERALIFSFSARALLQVP